MSRLDQFKRILDGFKDEGAQLQGAALFSDDGLIIAGNLPEGLEEMRVAAATAAFLSASAAAAKDLGRGRIDELIVRGEAGYAILSSTKNLILMVVADKTAKLGGVLLNVREAIVALNKIL